MGLYGTTIDIFSPSFAALSDDKRILLQAAYMRLMTEPGTYQEDPDYGLDVTELVQAELTDAEIGRLQQRIQSHLERDERVEEASVSVVVTDDELRIDVHVVGADGEEADFALAVTEETAEIIAGSVQ